MKARRAKHKSVKWASRGWNKGALVYADPVAVVRRCYFEAGTFEVVEAPAMKILFAGFDSEEIAQSYADRYNQERTKKNVVISQIARLDPT